MNPLINAVKEHGSKAVGGLTVASVVWIYATFASKDWVIEQEHTLRDLQKRVTVLEADKEANNRIIEYYFKGPSATVTNH